MIREAPEAVVCDLDGVIYRGDDALPGSVAAIEELQRNSVKVLFCTNNSRSTIDQYVTKLRRMGLEVAAGDIVTSAIVTAEVLQQRGFAGKTAIVVGGDGIRSALGDVCISVKEDPAVRRSDLLVVGWDPTFTYDALARAADSARGGAVFIATNSDASFPAANGILPGAGAIVAAIATASGATPEVMGKPHEPMLRALQRRLDGYDRIAVVGDRPETDLAGAAALGWTSVLVTSGVTSADAAHTVEPTPDLVVEDLARFVDGLF